MFITTCWSLCSYLAVRNAKEAASCLAKRGELSALQSAIQVLLAANETTAVKVYAQKYVHECLLVSDWSAASNMLRASSSFTVSRFSIKHIQINVICLTLVK